MTDAGGELSNCRELLAANDAVLGDSELVQSFRQLPTLFLCLAHQSDRVGFALLQLLDRCEKMLLPLTQHPILFVDFELQPSLVGGDPLQLLRRS